MACSGLQQLVLDGRVSPPATPWSTSSPWASLHEHAGDDPDDAHGHRQQRLVGAAVRPVPHPDMPFLEGHLVQPGQVGHVLVLLNLHRSSLSRLEQIR